LKGDTQENKKTAKKKKENLLSCTLGFMSKKVAGVGTTEGAVFLKNHQRTGHDQTENLG
jgi:hypothetical protein